MHQIKQTIGPPSRLLWEGCTPLLPCETAVAYLLCVVDLWQSTDHAVGGQPPKCIKVQVAIARMPPPGNIVVHRGEAHRLGYV